MYKVLIADDEVKVAQLTKALIKWEALKLELVGIAHDGIEAMDKIRALQPDIVITDIRMPGCDGLELIKETKTHYPKMEFIIISGYQHFDYAHNAIKYGVKDYLLKPLSEEEINQTLAGITAKYESEKRVADEMGKIVKQINHNRDTIRQQFAKSIFSQYERVVQTQSLQDLNDKYFYNFNQDVFRLLLLKPDIKYQKNNEAMLKLLMEKSKVILEKNTARYAGEAIVSIEVDRIYMLFNYDYQNREHLKKGLIRSVDDITSLRDIFKSINVTIALSEEVMAYDQISILKEQVDRRLRDRLLSSTNRLIESDHIEEASNHYLMYWDDSIKKSLTQKIRELDIEGYARVYKQWVSSIAVANTISGQGYFALAEAVNRLTIDTMLRFQLIDESYVSAHPICDIERDMARSVTQLMEIVLRQSVMFFEQALILRKERSQKPIEQAVAYIDQYFADAISLEQVSNVVGFNPSYFSTLFKKEMGKNFLEYLTTIRIQYAQQALSDASKSIAVIAEASGYSDVKHFSKQFKKQTGLTPAKYRKLYY